jgi:hypothetical protein
MESDHPDLLAAMRLVDQLNLIGFYFERCALGEDGSLVGNRASGGKIDLIYIEGFSHDCFARRRRTPSLIIPGRELIERHVEGSALDVLHEVLTWQES